MITRYNLTNQTDWEQPYNHHKTNPRIGENHKYNVGMIGLWDIGEYTGTPGDLVLGKVKIKILNTGCIIPKYQIEVLSDGLYNGRIMTVSEKNALEEIDPTPYLSLDDNKPGVDEHDISVPVENPNPSTCDIDSLMKSQCKLEGDILIAKQPDVELSLANGCGIPIKEEVERAIHNHSSGVTSQIDELHNKIDKTSKIAKLALLSKLISI